VAGIAHIRERRLRAGLDAQAQAETARAIQEVARPVPGGVFDLRDDGPTSYARQSDDHGEIGQAVDRFHGEALLQSRIWFIASVVAAGVGLAVIVWEILQASNNPALETVLRTVPGLVTGAIAALFYQQSNASRKHAADLLGSAQDDRRAATATKILSTIQDADRREHIAARLVMHLAGAPASKGPPAKPKSSGSARGRHGSHRSSEQPAPDADHEEVP